MITKVAIGQLCSGSNIAQNLETVGSLITQAIRKDVRLVFFPEATDFLSQNAAHSSALAKGSWNFVHQLQDFIKQLVQKENKKIDVSIGVHLPPERNDIENNDSRVKNVLLYINHQGIILHKYQKLHLFDVEVPNGPILMESKSIQPGSMIPEIVSTPAGSLGTAICYDIRFPELSLKLRSNGAELLCFPSAFTTSTGEAHWRILGRSRAIDTQCYVILPAQCGVHNITSDLWSEVNKVQHKKRESWGHSMIVDPWGTVIAEADPNNPDPQLIIADIDRKLIEDVRKKMPLWAQRRHDLY